jgi:hypothetical protein
MLGTGGAPDEPEELLGNGRVEDNLCIYATLSWRSLVLAEPLMNQKSSSAIAG